MGRATGKGEMTRLVIFDIDGTIVNAYDAIQDSINYSLKSFGYKKVSSLVVRRSVGLGDRNFVTRFVAPEDVERVLLCYRCRHKSDLLYRSYVMPGTKKVLAALKRKGMTLAIVSNRPRKFSLILLKHLGLRKYFNVIACAKDKSELKPKPKMFLKILKRLKIGRKEALYIGDMAIDVRAGRRAGIRTVAIAGGSSFKSELKRESPYRIITKISEIIPLL